MAAPLAGGGAAEIVSVATEEAPAGSTFRTYNLVVADFHTYFVGAEGVWVHNAAGRECQQIFSIYHRFRVRQQNTVEDAFRLLEQKIKFFVKKADDTPKLMGKALDDVIKKEVYPDLPLDSIWSNGKFSRGGANIWDHYDRHVCQELLFPDIDNAITYAKRAVEFTDQAPSGPLKVWIRERPNGLFDQVWCNETTREFAVKAMTGPKAGKLRTYYTVDPGQDIMEYMFRNQYVPGTSP